MSEIIAYVEADGRFKERSFYRSDYKTYLDDYKFAPRDEIEHDNSKRQLVSYGVISTSVNGILATTRLNGDERLVGETSVGIGGHVNKSDFEQGGDGVFNSMIREMNEEVSITQLNRISCLGLIATEDEVGQCHIGVLYDIGCRNVKVKETENLEQHFFKNLDPMDLDKFEKWSQVALINHPNRPLQRV